MRRLPTPRTPSAPLGAVLAALGLALVLLVGPFSAAGGAATTQDGSATTTNAAPGTTGSSSDEADVCSGGGGRSGVSAEMATER